MECYKEFRPTEFSDVVGQGGVADMLAGWVAARKVPHTIMFHGPSGCGKTTLARILAAKCGCGNMDLDELNCADVRGIDNVRTMRANMHAAPISGRCRVVILDECHKMTNDAQNAMLIMLEDTPKHVYFFLCTTDPGKVIKAIHTRSTMVGLKNIPDEDIAELLSDTAAKIKFSLSEEVRDRIVDAAEGSARQAMVLLETIRTIADEDAQLEAVGKANIKKEAIDICRMLMNPKAGWGDMAGVLRAVDGEPESLRYAVLGYATAILTKSDNARAFKIICAFERNFYDSKKAGLVASCYQVIKGK